MYLEANLKPDTWCSGQVTNLKPQTHTLPDFSEQDLKNCLFFKSYPLYETHHVETTAHI